MYAPPRKPILDAKLTWREALNAPSAKQMGYLRRLIGSRPFLTQSPDQSLFASEVGVGAEHIRALRGEGYVLIYTPVGKSFRVRLDQFTGQAVKAWWFDPRNGKTTAAGEFTTERARAFIPPGKPGIGNDWVLVLNDAAKNVPMPEQP